MPSAGTAVMGGISLLSSKKASDDAKKSRGISQDQLQLQIERDQFNKEQIEQMNKWSREEREDMLGRRDRARGMYDPLEEQLVAEAGEDRGSAVRRAQSEARGDVAQAFDVQRGVMRRQRGRYGVGDPSSGAMRAEERRLSSSEALGSVYAASKAGRAEEDRNWARKISVAGMGNLKDTTVNTNLAQLGVSGAAGVMGQQAAGYGASAAGAFALSGKTLADAINYIPSGGGDVAPPGTTDYGGSWYPGAS